MAQSHLTIPPGTPPHNNNASEDTDADSDSLDFELRSSPSTAADTASQDIEAESESFSTSCTNSPTSSPGAALACRRSEWLPGLTQAGYFVPPDPLWSGSSTDNTLEHIGLHAAMSSVIDGCILGEKTAKELENSVPLGNFPRGKRAEQNYAPSVNGEKSQFLPLLKYEPNYPKNPTFNRGLEKINERLRRATLNSEEGFTQSVTTQPVLGIHPALRQPESHSAIGSEQLAALQAEVKQLRANVRALERSATSKDSHQAEAVRGLYRNEEQLLGGWERMRNELWQIKVMQERLRRRSADMERNMENHW